MTSQSQTQSASLIRLTREQFDVVMRPQLQAFLSVHAAELGGHTVDEVQALCDLYDLVHGQSTFEWHLPLQATPPLPDVIGTSPACVTAIVGVAVGCVGLVMQAAGVPSNITHAVGSSVVNNAIAESPIILTTLEAEVAALSSAQGITAQAKAIFSLFGSINNVVPLTKILSAIKNELSWYQWMLMGVVITAQLTLWFSTGGTAALAELVLFGSAVAGLAISATSAYSVCNVPTSALLAMSPQPGPFVAIDVNTRPLAMLENGTIYYGQDDGSWISSGMTVEDFSAGLPSAIFPIGQFWSIANNAAGGDGVISRVDCNGNQIPTNGSASLISSADDGETWAIQASLQAMRWDQSAQQWSSVEGAFDQIVVSSVNLQWALAMASPGSDQTVILQRTSSTTTWTSVTTSPEATDIIQIATNAAGDLACVTADNRVFLYVAEGCNWIQLGGDDISAQSICIRDPNNVWLIDINGQAQHLGPLLNPSDNPGLVQWDTEDVWDETRSTHLYLVNRAAQLVGTCTTAAYQNFAQNYLQPMVGRDQAGPFRQGLCQGLYDADFLSAYNNPNWLGQPTWKSHFYDASTGQNYMGETTPTALSNGVSFIQQSLTVLQQGPDELYKGGYLLGLALHYFTDLTQPMHAANYTYLSSFPFGYHTDFELYAMSVQATVSQPTVTGFQPGSVTDVATLYQATATFFKQNYFSPVEQAHLYASWKWSPSTWQAAVLPLLPTIFNNAVGSTAQLLYLYIEGLLGVPSRECTNFTGPYAANNWVEETSATVGTLWDLSDAPGSITLKTDPAWMVSTDWMVIQAPATGLITFNWTCTSGDGSLQPCWYIVNGVRTLLNISAASGLAFIPVNVGDSFAIMCQSNNAVYSSLTITNFSGPIAIICTDFTGPYAAENWTETTSASVSTLWDLAQVPTAITLNTDPNWLVSTDWMSIRAAATGIITFNWACTSGDGNSQPCWYAVNSINTLLNTSSSGGSISVPVNSGDTFAIICQSNNSVFCGLTISNFQAPM